jgi:hypothetical protein
MEQFIAAQMQLL